MILDTLAASQFSYSAGTAASVTVAAGKQVTGIACHASGSGATLTITPGGPNQAPVAGDAIPIPPTGWFSIRFMGELGPGTVLAFSGTDSYLVTYAKLRAG